MAVIEDDPRPDRRFADKAFIFVEVVSSTDRQPVLPGGEPWIEAKARLYRSHSPCEAVVVVEQRRIEVRVSHRTDASWESQTPSGENEIFALPTCGLRCLVGDLYAGTHLRPGGGARSERDGRGTDNYRLSG